MESMAHGSRPRPRTQKSLRPRTDPLEAKAKDQGHRRKCSSKKKRKKRSSKFFFRRSQKKGLEKIFSGRKEFFFRQSPIEENKKRSSQICREVSGVFLQNYNSSKNSAVLEQRTGQFSRTRGFKAKDLKMCPRRRPRDERRPQGLHLCWGQSPQL